MLTAHHLSIKCMANLCKGNGIWGSSQTSKHGLELTVSKVGKPKQYGRKNIAYKYITFEIPLNNT